MVVVVVGRGRRTLSATRRSVDESGCGGGGGGGWLEGMGLRSMVQAAAGAVPRGRLKLALEISKSEFRARDGVPITVCISSIL